MNCCDQHAPYGCNQGRDCPVRANAAKVAPIKTTRARQCHEIGVCPGKDCDCEKAYESAAKSDWLRNAAAIPAQAGNVWFAEPEPDDHIPLSRLELCVFWLTVGSACGAAAIIVKLGWVRWPL
jgi:hypothetical protein